MTVIAMTRELGALGQDVAVRVAGELGLDLVHDDLIERHLAARLNVGEDIVRRFLMGEASLWERWKIDVRRMSQFTAVEILLLARRGDVVIRGWGAAQLLRGISHVTCIRVCAPMPFRVARMKQRLKIESDAAAEREIQRSDEAHDRTVRKMFGTDWHDPTGYAMVLNTADVSIETAGELLLHLARARRDSETPESRQQLEDALVLARVREALGAGGAYGLDLSIDNGIVTVSGALMANHDVERLLDVIREVEGVRGVHEEVQIVPYNFGA